MLTIVQTPDAVHDYCDRKITHRTSGWWPERRPPVIGEVDEYGHLLYTDMFGRLHRLHPDVLDFERKRAEKGAAMLDEHVPGWADVVDLDSLWMTTTDVCVGGQVGWACLGSDGGYASGLRHLIEEFQRVGAWGEQIDLYATGFGTSSNDGYAALEVAWHALVKERREET